MRMAAEFVGKVTEKELEESFQNIKNANVSQAEEVFENYDRKVANVENCEILCLDEADKLPSQDFKCMLDKNMSDMYDDEGSDDPQILDDDSEEGWEKPSPIQEVRLRKTYP